MMANNLHNQCNVFFSTFQDPYLGGMYSEWTSVSPQIQSLNEERNSVLNKFPIHVGKNVVTSVLKPLASNLGITQASEPSPFVSDEEVQWNMQVGLMT